MSKPITILHVEDNEDDRRLIQIYLEKSLTPFRLTSADSLRTAQDILGRQSFDVILLDLDLPDAWGSELYQAIRGRAAKTPILILSGSVEENKAAFAKIEGEIFKVLPKTGLKRDLLVENLLRLLSLSDLP